MGGGGGQAQGLLQHGTGLVDRDVQRGQLAIRRFVAFEFLEAIQGAVEAQHGLLHRPGGIATLDRQQAQGVVAVLGAELGGGIGGGALGLTVAPGIEAGGLAAAHQQDALGGDAGQGLHKQSLARFAVDVAGFEDGAQGALAGCINRLAGVVELAAIKYAENQAGGLDGGGGAGLDLVVHERDFAKVS